MELNSSLRKCASSKLEISPTQVQKTSPIEILQNDLINNKSEDTSNLKSEKTKSKMKKMSNKGINDQDWRNDKVFKEMEKVNHRQINIIHNLNEQLSFWQEQSLRSKIENVALQIRNENKIVELEAHWEEKLKKATELQKNELQLLKDEADESERSNLKLTQTIENLEGQIKALQSRIRELTEEKNEEMAKSYGSGERKRGESLIEEIKKLNNKWQIGIANQIYMRLGVLYDPSSQLQNEQYSEYEDYDYSEYRDDSEYDAHPYTSPPYPHYPQKHVSPAYFKLNPMYAQQYGVPHFSHGHGGGVYVYGNGEHGHLHGNGRKRHEDIEHEHVRYGNSNLIMRGLPVYPLHQIPRVFPVSETQTPQTPQTPQRPHTAHTSQIERAESSTQRAHGNEREGSLENSLEGSEECERENQGYESGRDSTQYTDYNEQQHEA